MVESIPCAVRFVLQTNTAECAQKAGHIGPLVEVVLQLVLRALV